MVVKLDKGDIFEADRGTCIVHCIPADLNLDIGLAREINGRYHMMDKLEKRSKTECITIGDAILVEDVYNLVVCEHPYSPIEYEDITEALISLREQCEENGTMKLAMPKICSGYGGKDFEIIADMICDIFDKSDIMVTLYM